MGKTIACVLLAAVVFVPLACAIYSSQEVSDEQRQAVAQLFVNPGQCRPEPGERLVYLTGLFFFPVAILGLSYVIRQLKKRGGFRAPRGLPWLLDLIGCGLLFGIFIVSMVMENGYHLRRNLFYKHPLISLPIVALSLAVLRFCTGQNQWVVRAARVLTLTLTVLLALCCVFDENADYASDWHFTATFNSVVQVHFGKAVLVDCASQYGLYPHFLNPLFSVWGLSVLKFSLVMGLLLAASYLALWEFLRGIIKNLWVAITGFFALVFVSWFFLKFPGDGGHYVSVDHYFQYFPLRFVFPSGLVLLSWKYFCRPNRWLYWGTTLFLSAGVLWNFDSGLPALVTWVATLCYSEMFATEKVSGPLFRKRVLTPFLHSFLHLAAAGVTLGLVVTAYSVAIYLAYGAFPDYRQFFQYQRLFYVTGFFMLPMKAAGTWTAVILVYLGGLARAAFALTTGRRTVKHQMVFLLSTLGVGLFSYYQGRSHPYVLSLVWWPCFLLMAIFLDELIGLVQQGSRRPLHLLAATLLAWLLGGYAWAVLADAGSIKYVLAEQLFPRSGPKSYHLSDEAAFIKQHTIPGERTLILASGEAALHLEAGVPPIAPSSYIEMVTLDDYVNVCRSLAQQQRAKVYVDKKLFDGGWKHVGSRLLIDMIEQSYEVTQETAGGYLLERRDCSVAAKRVN
jgi:hypothetical protein